MRAFFLENMPRPCRSHLRIIKKFLNLIFFVLAAGGLVAIFSFPLFAETLPENKKTTVYQSYLDSFEEIYKLMAENYYYPVNRKDFDRFIVKFNSEIFKSLEDQNTVNDFAMMRSGAFLVDYLKTKDDRFSALYPPQVAKEYEQEVLGVRVDLGITGSRCAEGYCVSFVESRADAFEKGLRPNDVITKIDHRPLASMTDEEIQKALTPEMNKAFMLEYRRPNVDGLTTITVTSKEYFKETVFPVTIPYPGIYCLEIRQFNRMTAADFSKYLFLINQQKSVGLILDLRGNPGGPPLAAREIVSFFLQPEKNFVYFERKGDTRNYLDVPKVPEEYRYPQPIIILVNEGSGSASELFSGVMQKERHAVLMGTNTAGQVFLKSMFNLKDGAMLLLVTARGHFTDGNVFDFNGLTPEYRTDAKGADLVYFAAGYLLGLANKK